MSLRTRKIPRDVFNSFKQLTTYKSDLASLSSNRTQIEHVAEGETTEENNSIRYIVTNTKRPEVLPKIEFPKSPEELIPPEMRHLQPAMLPKFMELREDPENTRWELKENTTNAVSDPFPEPIRELRTKTITLSDQKKAEQNYSIRVRLTNLNTFNRTFCTSPLVIPFRSMASDKRNNRNEKKHFPNREHCEKDAKVECQKNSRCPKFFLPDCPQRTESDCNHKFFDRKCKKKNAPYPSYSESCAERLEDDPSECVQCPWQRCEGIQFKTPSRKYHQLASTGSNFFVPTTIMPLYSPAVLDLDYNCDASKEPCKQPPSKCEIEEEIRKKQKDKERIQNMENDRHFPKDKNKNKFSIIDALLASDRKIWGKLPFDKNLGDYDYVRKRKCNIDQTKCKRKKKRIVPEGCYPDNCKKCDQFISNDLNSLSFLEYECKSKHPKGDCPPIKITPQPIDRSYDSMSSKSDDVCKKEKKKEKARCPPEKKEEETAVCPKDKGKKPKYRKEKDLNNPEYQRHSQHK